LARNAEEENHTLPVPEICNTPATSAWYYAKNKASSLLQLDGTAGLKQTVAIDLSEVSGQLKSQKQFIASN